MKNPSSVAVGIVTMLAVETAAAEGQRPLREARSENGRFVLRIAPGQPGRAGRDCRAGLYDSSERGRAGRRIWERALVNAAAPVLAFVRNDGRFVVTLDEYRRGGARHALVIYGDQGELLRHLLLTDVLEKSDWPHVKAERREVVWLKDARCAFDDRANQFLIELPWGRKIRIDLKTLQLVRAGERSSGAEFAVVPAEIFAQLFGVEEGGERGAAEPLAELAKLTPEEQAQAAAIAEQLATGDRTAKEAQPEAASGEAVPGVQTDAGAATVGGKPPAKVTAEAAESVEGQAAMPEPEIVVPPPNPAEKVDYVAWLNEMGRIDGPDANLVYEAAFAQVVPWEGDANLLQAAARGDPAALESPEITAWLAQNAAAVAKFREASQYGAKGWNVRSRSESMIEVMLPSLAPIRNLARANVIEGRRLVADGRSAEAAQHYLDVAAAGAHTGSGLTLIENLVGVAMQAMAADAYLDLQADPSATTLNYTDLASDAEAACRPMRSAAQAIQGERAFLMDAVQRTWDVDPQTGKYVLNRELVKQFMTNVDADSVDRAQLQQDLTRLEEIGYEQTAAVASAYYDALTMAFTLPYPQASQRIEELETLMVGDENTNPFLRRLTPSLARYHFIETRGETTRRAALLVTNLHAYQQQHGEYPPSLDVFADREFAVDPFGDTHFVYRRIGNDFSLYSVGGNSRDDAGVHDPKGNANDLVFWPRPVK